MSNKVLGVDTGTNSLCVGYLDEDGSPKFKLERNAFFRITPKSDVNKQAIRGSLEKRGCNFIVEGDDLIVVGEQSLHIAMERNQVSSRPMAKGVISPKDKSNLPMLKLLLSSLIGKGDGDTPLVYGIPGSPVDGSFNVEYHNSILEMFFKEQGFAPSPINEAFAIALSELIDHNLTGMSVSMGAGMCNVSIIHQGEPLAEFAILRSGDAVDQLVAEALDISPSLVQLEKEAGIDLYNPSNKIVEAVSVYYASVLNYIMKTIAYELKLREKTLPIFREPMPIVVSGGLTLAEGFVRMFEEKLAGVSLPMKIKEVRRVSSPMTCVANGALLAAQL
jgi:hypothetical protein